MIHERLKQLRLKYNLTLKVLSFKVGYGTGNLSSYENGKLKPKDKTLMRILTRGYEMSSAKAKAEIARWRKKEFEETYHLQLAQITESYNNVNSSTTLDEYLKAEGLDKETIEKIKEDIKFYKKRVK